MKSGSNYHLFLFPLIGASLLLGVLSGLFRIGWYNMGRVATVADLHGAFMVGGFLGTLIIVERALPLKKWYAFLPAILSGSSLLFFLLGFKTVALGGLTLGSLGLMYIMYYYYTTYELRYQLILLIGAACWFVGNALLFWGTGFFTVVPWWMAFLLFTICGERLELTRFMPGGLSIQRWLLLSLALFLLGCIFPFHAGGEIILGVSWCCTGLWLLKWDVARKAIRKKGIHRYAGIMLLLGYGWLLVSGTLILLWPMRGLFYDAILHSFFIGFVFSMIFAHAPVILPAVCKMTGTLYHRSLYIWGILLHISLLVRIVADLYMLAEIRKWSGMITGLILLAFIVEMAGLAMRRKRLLHKSSQQIKCTKAVF